MFRGMVSVLTADDEVLGDDTLLLTKLLEIAACNKEQVARQYNIVNTV